MVALLRLGCWLAAIFFALSPLVMGIATGPQFLRNLFTYQSYATHGRDLIFTAIAVLAIGLIDSLETILFVRNRRGWLNGLRFGFTFLLMLFIVIQLFIYASWSASMSPTMSNDDVAYVITVVGAGMVCAMLARVALIRSPIG